jgi:DNA polymerase III delta prime subunit
MQTKSSNIPWVEKYRPSNFDNIVLTSHNEEILNNMLTMNIFPNLLLYGPPGTGKTTTIINFINKYQELNNEKHPELKIHLNASDERGIDIIRNQIYNFVDSKSLFCKGTKFVILDEVDYMTKNAQQALKYLIQQFDGNVKFCLICNYISKIDIMLKNEFFCIRFHHLPSLQVKEYLQNIVEKEQLTINENEIQHILDYYDSDMRSMINFLQTHQYNIDEKYIINAELWDILIASIKTKTPNKVVDIFRIYCNKYNKDEKNMIKNFIYYLLNKKKYTSSTEDFLTFVENLIHSKQNKYYVSYFFVKVGEFLS